MILVQFVSEALLRCFQVERLAGDKANMIAISNILKAVTQIALEGELKPTN